MARFPRKRNTTPNHQKMRNKPTTTHTNNEEIIFFIHSREGTGIEGREKSKDNQNKITSSTAAIQMAEEECTSSTNQLTSTSTFVHVRASEDVTTTEETSISQGCQQTSDWNELNEGIALPIKLQSLSSSFIETNREIIIGRGVDQFEIKVCIEKCINFSCFSQFMKIHSPEGAGDKSSFLPTNLWLSYRLLNTVIQSVMLSGEEASLDFPMLHTFQVKSSLPELMHYFNNKEHSFLKVHVCTEGEILGTSYIDLRELFVHNNNNHTNCDGSSEGRMVNCECLIKPRSNFNVMMAKVDRKVNLGNNARISVRLCIDQESKYQNDNTTVCSKNSSTAVIHSYSSTSSQTTKMVHVDRATSPRQDVEQISPDTLAKKAEKLNIIEAELSNKEKDLLYQVACLERKRCEWEQWRHQEEIVWHEGLREKEAFLQKSLDKRVSEIEEERNKTLELAKNEYGKLETRLRKALGDVEAKERQLKHAEISYQSERKNKLAELELKEKLLRDELKHSIEIEVRDHTSLSYQSSKMKLSSSHSNAVTMRKRAKVAAAEERAIAAQNIAAAANKKVNQVEIQMDQLREKHRSTPEVALLHQVAELKGLLADSERRMQVVNGEKNTIIEEKEQFQLNVHKLGRALRKEREKLVRKKRECNNNQQVCLSYDKHENAFALHGDQDEIHQILVDLGRISKVKGKHEATPMSIEAVCCQNRPPIPTSPPLHPVIKKRSI